MRKTTVLTAMVLALASATAEAKVLYVDATNGSDARSYASNGESAPWATIGRAAWGSTNRNAPNASEAARAGDTVIIRGGVYTVAGTDERYLPAYNPINSGTSTQPILFTAEGAVVLRLSSSRGPVIGAFQRNYIHWRGFTIHEMNAPSRPDTGPVVLWQTTGSAVENLDINGNGDPGYGDNHTGIRIEYGQQITVRSNRITNFRTSVVNSGNGSAVQVYFSGDILFENNEITDCGSGIFLKAPADDTQGTGHVGQFTIRYNRISNTDYGIAVHRSPNTAAEPARIYQNIVTNSNIGIRIWTFDQGPTDPRNVKVVNNTLHNNQTGLHVNGNLVANAGHLFFNNIVTNSGSYAINFGGSASTLTNATLDVEHNTYWAFGRFAIVFSTEHTFTSWKTATGQDSVSPASANSDPIYSNASIGDFTLAPGSPALTGGLDIFDLDNDGSTTDMIPKGAYVTGSEWIGRTNGITRPSAPTNLRITR